MVSLETKTNKRTTVCPRCSDTLHPDPWFGEYDKCLKCKIFVHCNKEMNQAQDRDKITHWCTICTLRLLQQGTDVLSLGRDAGYQKHLPVDEFPLIHE